MRANALEKLVLAAVLVVAGAALGAAATQAHGFAAAHSSPARTVKPALILAQNAFTPFSLPETGEPTVLPGLKPVLCRWRSMLG